MAKIIQFKSRAILQLEKDNLKKDEWDAFEDWEKEMSRREQGDEGVKSNLDVLDEKEIEWLKTWLSQGVISKEQI